MRSNRICCTNTSSNLVCMRVTNAYGYQHSRARFDALEYAYLATSGISNDDKLPSNLNAVIRVRSLGPPEVTRYLQGPQTFWSMKISRKVRGAPSDGNCAHVRRLSVNFACRLSTNFKIGCTAYRCRTLWALSVRFQIFFGLGAVAGVRFGPPSPQNGGLALPYRMLSSGARRTSTKLIFCYFARFLASTFCYSNTNVC